MSQYKHRKAKDAFRTTEILAYKSDDVFYLKPEDYLMMQQYHGNLIVFYSRMIKNSRERNFLEMEADRIKEWLDIHQFLKQAA